MSAIHITLAVEDELSERVARKMLRQSEQEFAVTQCLGKKGFGYLKSRINKLNQAAKGLPFFVLTDQDNGCPPDKIREWLRDEIHPNMIFRIAVMEIESWIMAHRAAFAEFLEIPKEKIPLQTDEIPDPKQFLLNLARKSRAHRLKQDLLPAGGSTSTQGPDYNGRLCLFVDEYWDVHQARLHSESLNRACIRLQAFQAKYHPASRSSLPERRT